MPDLQAAIESQGKMEFALNHVTQSMTLMMVSYEKMEASVSRGFDTSGLETFQYQAERASAELQVFQSELAQVQNMPAVMPEIVEPPVHELQLPVVYSPPEEALQLPVVYSPPEEALQLPPIDIPSSQWEVIDTGAEQLANDYNKVNAAVISTKQSIGINIVQQENFNRTVEEGNKAAGALEAMFGGIASRVAGAFDIKKVLALSDSMTQIRVRLDQMNDGMQSTEELNQKIAASAQRARVPYMETADAIAQMGIKAGNAFTSNDEMIAFTEQVNKQFAIGGASAQEQAGAMAQLTQAMASGTLQGGELNAMLDAAPGIAQAIEESMGWAEGSIRQYAEKGQVSAQVVKNALLGMADETDKKFQAMPMTFGQLFTGITDSLLQTFMPLIQLIGQGASFIAENWDTIGPVFYGVVAGILAAAAAWGIYSLFQLLASTETAAFITTLMASPFFWIAVVIGIIVTAILQWIQSVGGLKIAWLTVVDAVKTRAGELMLTFTDMMMNLRIMLANMTYGFTAFTNGVLNTLGTLKAQGLIILQNFINGSIDAVNGLIKTVNKITGAGINTITWTADFGTKAVEDEAEKKQNRENDLARMKAENDADAKTMQSDRARMQSELDAAKAERSAVLEQLRREAEQKNSQNSRSQGLTAGDLAAKLDNSGLNAGNTAANTGATAANTGSMAADTAAMADHMDVIDEDLKYMRDAAEQEIINRFTLAELKIDLTNHNTLKTETDFDRMNGMLTEVTNEILSAGAEGGHL